MTITIQQHAPGTDLDAFVKLPFQLFANDPVWVAPLLKEVHDRLNPRKNPFFEHGEAMFFTAWKDNIIVGRCSAQVDREHLRVHNDRVGFFGLLDTIDDQSVCDALLAAAQNWLIGQGMKAMRGPISLTMNDEVGTLTSGFEQPHMFMMPHATPYQGRLIEAAGLASVKTLYAWHLPVSEPPARAIRAWNQINAMPQVRFRSVNTRKLASELVIVNDILADAWADNWGFVPMTQAEMQKAVFDLKLVIDSEIAFFAEIDGRPMAMCVCLPNLNEAIADFNGRLTPVNIVKLLWRLKFNRPKSARVVVLGIRKELRSSRRYAALSAAIYVEASKRAHSRGYEWSEMGWTLDDNKPVNAGIRRMNGTIYKQYQIYEKPIDI